MDTSFDALAFVGQHAKAGTPYSHITHTGWFDAIDLSINGISIGEYGQFSLCAMELGVPTILACGEEALCREAEALTPGVFTVSGKRGLLPDGLDDLDSEAYRKAKLGAIHRSPTLVRKDIREQAALSLCQLQKDRGSFRYPDLKPPYTRVAKFRPHKGRPAREASDGHPDSVIALLNQKL